MLHKVLLVAALASTTFRLAAAQDPDYASPDSSDCSCGYYIPETQLVFTNRSTLDASLISPTDNLQDALNNQGYEISTDTLDDSTPLKQKYTVNNVVYNAKRSAIDLVVTGSKKRKQQYVKGAEISSFADTIRYGSFRYTLQYDKTPGACSGAFFYKNDTDEVDMEVVTRYMYGTSPQQGALHPRGMQFSIQGPDGQTKADSFRKRFDPTQKFHTYRFDWEDGKVVYYVDGNYWDELDGWTPGEGWEDDEVGGKILLNNWSNGDPSKPFLYILCLTNSNIDTPHRMSI